MLNDTSTSSSTEVAASSLTHSTLSPPLISCNSLRESHEIGDPSGTPPNKGSAKNTPNCCSNFAITVSDTAYQLAERNKKVVATYDTGATRSLQGDGRIPQYCAKDIVKDSQAAICNTPSGTLTIRRSVVLLAELTNDETGDRFCVWFISKVADRSQTPLLISGASMGFNRE